MVDSKRPRPDALENTARAVRNLIDPRDYFSGVRLEEAMFPDNIVVYRRTTVEMLRPQGITHNYHHRFEIVIPLREAGRVHIDGVAYLLAPGHVFLLFPHQFHHFLDIEGADFCWLFVTFEFNQSELLEPLRNSPRSLAPEDVEFVRASMESLGENAPGPRRSFELIVNVGRLLQRLLEAREANCVHRPDGRGDDPRGQLLQSINGYVRANLDRSLSLADLAQHTGYSVSYLRAVFRKEFGVSLGSYMRNSRLSAAAAMLARKDHGSIESVAKACGFDSIFVFSRAFKKAMGRPPGAYNRFVTRS